jgi:FtsP/CotA-like multicopper oxidase with cupredoxin domain
LFAAIILSPLQVLPVTAARGGRGGQMVSRISRTFWFLATLTFVGALPAAAQSFRVQCPTSTITHPTAPTSSQGEPVYNGPTVFATAAATPTDPGGYLFPKSSVNGAIKCQQVSGGDGYATMADGTQTFMFSFGPLSGLTKIANGQPGTDFPDEFNLLPASAPQPGDPATSDGIVATSWPAAGTPLSTAGFNWDGAVGLTPDVDCINGNRDAQTAGAPLPCPNLPALGLDGHVDPRQIMDVGVMNGNIPAPLVAFDEDDEMFLTLSNVGMIMRPDLFEQHTIHFHGYPNASSVYDGVPDASVAINIGGSFTYYYFSPDAGTYFWHCHITPPEHLQMGMVGQLYVRPRQNRVPSGESLYQSLVMQQKDLRTGCNTSADILCANPLPPSNSVTQGVDKLGNPQKYVYNDGDGSTAYDVEYALQIHGFDPNFHFVGMTFNPENFATMKDKYFLLSGRSYPDTVQPGPMATQSSDGRMHYSQPLPSIINIPVGGKALLRIADLDVSEYQTLASLGIPMKEVGFNAKLLRDQGGNDMEFYTNSITLGGGESLDVILDASDASCGSTGCAASLYPAGSKFYLYTPNLDHLSNGEENFGGLMTEVNICSSITNGVCN